MNKFFYSVHTLNRGDSVKQRKLKKSVIPFVYAGAIVLVLGCAYMIEFLIQQEGFQEDDKYGYVSETIFEDVEPVINSDVIITRPYTDPDVTVVKDYYDYKADSAKQESSLILYENTYLQNSGVSFGGKENFDVTAILDGTVSSVDEDELLGKIVEVKHDNNLISVYQSLSTVDVKKGDTVKQGQVLGKSGTSNVEKDLGDHLHFELIDNGQTVNPNEYFDQKVKSEEE